MLCSYRASLWCVSSWLHIFLIRFQGETSVQLSEDNTTIHCINNYSHWSIHEGSVQLFNSSQSFVT